MTAQQQALHLASFDDGIVRVTSRSAIDDHGTLGRLATQAQVITFDYENVPADTARWLAEQTRVAPNPHALATAQDRLAEKTLFQRIALPTAEFRAVGTRAELQRAIAEIGTPCASSACTE